MFTKLICNDRRQFLQIRRSFALWTSSCLDSTSFSKSPQLPVSQHDGISRLPVVGCCGSATRKTSLWQDGLVTCPASDECKNLVAVNKIIRPAFYGSANFTDAQNPLKYQMEINEQSLTKVKQLYLQKNLHTQFDIFTKWTWQEHSLFLQSFGFYPLVTIVQQSAGRAM